jgi:tetratricopeptide (TPR) repeat protein
MAKIGRNDPCPCGSGQKYKRCCGPRDDAAAAERAAADRAAALARQTQRFAPETAIGGEDDGLDDASNVVIDLIDAGRLDEAEHAAQDLLERYPEVHDGLERLAMVAAARGDRLRAAGYYRKAADFVHAHADQYGPKMEVYLRARATEFGAPIG